MISKDEAIRIAKEFMAREYPLENDEYMILDEHTREEETYWNFYYQSKGYLETGDLDKMIWIHVPLLVYKKDGYCELSPKSAR